MVKPSAGKSDPDDPDPDDLVAIFGANLKTARMKAGLTQAKLAEQSGLLQQYVSLVESGKQNVCQVAVNGRTANVLVSVRELIESLESVSDLLLSSLPTPS